MLTKPTDGTEHTGRRNCGIMHGRWSSGPLEESDMFV
jgi:hypothetical protein